MFKTLEIKNFKSISHAKFDLGKINVLTGQSNLGKSNVVQAIYCLTHNHWDSNYMRWGEKKCSIKLTNENDEWVEYRHSETSAEYLLSSVAQPFTKIGRDVPQAVKDFLKMNCVQFDEDLELDFNFERQFDPSFVISLSGFELAKVFGKLMNLDIVMTASRNINKDIVALRKNVEAQEALENVSISYIQEKYPIELKYALLHKALQVDSKAEEMDRENSELLSVLTDIEYYTECAKVYSEFLNSDKAKQIDTIREPIQGLDNVLVSLTLAVAAKDAYSKALTKKIPDFDFNALYGLINGLTGLVVESEKASAYKSALDKIGRVDFNVITSITENKSMVDSLMQWEVEKTYEISQLSKQEEVISRKVTDFNKFLKENNICPISGKPFKEGCVESIVAGVS